MTGEVLCRSHATGYLPVTAGAANADRPIHSTAGLDAAPPPAHPMAACDLSPLPAIYGWTGDWGTHVHGRKDVRSF